MFLHAKPMKNIAFSWFSLSELVQRSRHAYRGGRWRHRCKSPTATPPIRPRGKVAPQSPLEESATTEASRMWHENGRVRWSYCSKNLFIECSFHEITIEFLLELVQKVEQSHRHTNRQNPADIELGRGHVLDSSHADTIRKCLQNLSPKRPSDSC